MMDHVYDVVIIGGGPGGYTAALYCARAGLKTLVLEKLSAGGQMALSPHVENYPGFFEGISGMELADKMQQGAEHFGAVTEYAEATGLELKSDPKVVHTSSGDFEAKTVIFAAGANPKELNVPGEAEMRGDGVSYCATCDGPYFKGKTVAVAGGGDSAVQDALELSKVCKKVYLVHRRDTLRASESYWEPLHKAPNIEMVWNARIDEIQHEKDVTGLSITDKVTGKSYVLPCDGVFVAVGRTPDTSLLKGQVDLDEQGYIIAGETTKTNIGGVFAAGDVRTKPLRQIVTAAADGAVASQSAEEYIRSL